jgi:hypothetical protein
VSREPTGRRLVQGAALLLVAGSTLAILVQDHTDALPLGLFNEARGSYELLSAACLAIAVGILTVLAFEFASRRGARLGGLLRSALVFFVILEVLLFVADTTLVSRRPQGKMGGPYVERRGAPGEWVFLMRAHAGSPFGFRAAAPYAREPDGLRLLFLGDSYTEGSGRALDCNYPTVVESALAGREGSPLEVMNAGVGGYGPEDALHLLRFLVEQGYRFDAVVYNLFLENDFTDNLPGTTRRVVAGMNDRFPRALWMRMLHPLNSRSFRFALFLWRVGSLTAAQVAVISRDEGACLEREEPDATPSPALGALVRRRLEGSRRVLGSEAALAVVSDAVKAMHQEANRLGVPFVLVVFPDRILVDDRLRAELDLHAGALEAPQRLRAWTLERFASLPSIDVTPALAAAAGLYRPVATHLSDRGNRVAGRFVAEHLAELVPLGRGAARLDSP